MQLGLLRQGDWAGIVTMAIGLARAADRAGGRQQGRLVRLRLHRAAVGDRRRSRCPPSSWIELTGEEAAAQPAPAGCAAISASASLANFLLGIALYGSVFILPLYLSRIQGYNAEQIGMVLAWTGLPQLLLIPLVPRLMQTLRRRASDRHRLRAVRRQQLHEHPHDHRLRRRPAVLAEHRARDRPGAGDDAAVGGRHAPASRRRMPARPRACST